MRQARKNLRKCWGANFTPCAPRSSPTTTTSTARSTTRSARPVSQLSSRTLPIIPAAALPAIQPFSSSGCWSAASPMLPSAASGTQSPRPSLSKQAKARDSICASAAKWASCPATRLTCKSRLAKSRSTPSSISDRTSRVSKCQSATRSPSAPTASISC